MKAEDTEKVWYKSPLGAGREAWLVFRPGLRAAGWEIRPGDQSSGSQGLLLVLRLEAPRRCASCFLLSSGEQLQRPSLPPSPTLLCWPRFDGCLSGQLSCRAVAAKFSARVLL